MLPEYTLQPFNAAYLLVGLNHPFHFLGLKIEAVIRERLNLKKWLTGAGRELTSMKYCYELLWSFIEKVHCFKLSFPSRWCTRFKGDLCSFWVDDEWNESLGIAVLKGFCGIMGYDCIHNIPAHYIAFGRCILFLIQRCGFGRGLISCGKDCSCDNRRLLCDLVCRNNCKIYAV